MTTPRPVASTEVLPKVVRDLLAARGYVDDESIERFLRPDYDRDLADPFLMTDMDKAVKRILQAAKAKQKVVVYGDYDIDGVTSTTLMLELLAAHGITASSYIPDRFDEGYGLHQPALEQMKADGVDLVVSVDCGITAVEPAEWAKANGLDLLITDHHEPLPSGEVPDAVAVVNPRRPGDEYPFKDLAGVGVVFALARALQQRTDVPMPGREKWWLDLVALGTVCDVMPLVGENRLLVKYGLIVLAKTRRIGLVALAQSAGLELADVRPYHLGFVLGPRLNAAGRMQHANRSLALLTSQDTLEAQKIAYELEELNTQRQLEQARIFEEADALAADYEEDPVLVLMSAEWSHGIVGIVASKLAEKWSKPVLLLQRQGDSAKGSGRSSGGYNLIEALQSQRPLFTKLGGHAFAAGFTLDVANLSALRQALNEHYRTVAADLPTATRRQADAELPDLAEANWDLLYALQRLEPFGNGNPQPVLAVAKLKVVRATLMGRDKTHLRLTLADTTSGATLEAVGFSMAAEHGSLKPGQVVDEALFTLDINEYNGERNLQLRLVEIHP